MTPQEASRLIPGREVFWNDPDGGACSRYLTIASIRLIDEDDVAQITTVEGDVLECFVSDFAPYPNVETLNPRMRRRAMAKKKKPRTYTVRVEWWRTYYGDFTVKASSPDEAADIAMAEAPDFDLWSDYDDCGPNYVAGVCVGGGYDRLRRCLGNQCPVEIAPSIAARCAVTIRDAAARLAGLDPALAIRLLDAAEAME